MRTKHLQKNLGTTEITYSHKSMSVAI